MTGNITLSGYVQGTAVGVVNGRTAFSIEVSCTDKGLTELIQKRIKNFLENDNIFATEVADIENNKTIEGQSLVEFLLGENFVQSASQARRMISSGAVMRKDTGGEWKIVGAIDANIRPGWWRVIKRGIVKIGADYIIEKRLSSKGVFSKPVNL